MELGEDQQRRLHSMLHALRKEKCLCGRRAHKHVEEIDGQLIIFMSCHGHTCKFDKRVIMNGPASPPTPPQKRPRSPPQDDSELVRVALDTLVRRMEDLHGKLDRLLDEGEKKRKK